MKTAFLIGVDSNQQWMYNWFRTNLLTHNPDANLIVADFGMKKDFRSTVERDHPIVDLTADRKPGKAWYLKPLAIQRSIGLAERLLWMDTDCEVLAPIGEIFDYCIEGKLALSQDPIAWQVGRRAFWQTGVVGVTGESEILDRWVKASVGRQYRGDQEALFALIRNGRDHVNEFPMVYQWLRCMLNRGKDNPHKKVIHWTGNRGKDKIRSLIKTV